MPSNHLSSMTEAIISQTIPLFLSPDNSVRNSAEQTFIATRQDPSAFITALQKLAVSFPQPELRQMAAVLLRRNLTSDIWSLVDKSSQESVKANLLASVSTEPEAQVKKAIAEAVSKLASIVCTSGNTIWYRLVVILHSNLYGTGTWSELLPAVFQLCLSSDQKEVGLKLLFSLSESLPDNSLLPVLQHILPMISASLAVSQELSVRACAVHAFYGVCGHVQEGNNSERDALQSLVVCS